MEKPKVILRKCDEYQADRIQGLIREGIEELGCDIRGKVFIKPNVVTASKKHINSSYTNPAVVEAMVGVLKDNDPQSIQIGESGGYGSPSRFFFKEAGYYEMAKKLGVELFDLNERSVERVALKKASWHKEILLSRALLEADFKVWLPKLKYHIFASITNALKLNIGILTHKERMLYHDYRIHEKVVDLLEAGYPDLIVSDAVDITYGWESAPYPVRLGMLMISNHPLAVDAVAAYIMGYDPREVKHLAIAAERGYGSLNLSDIHITGDADVEEMRARPKGKTRLFQFLSELETPIQFYGGCVPGTDTICDGGCEGAVKGCLGMIEKRSPGSLKRALKGAIVTGVYRGDVIMPDGPVLLVGDCTTVEGKLEAKKVHRVKGCPNGVIDLIIKLPFLFSMPSPILDKRDTSLIVYNTILKGMSILKNRVVLNR